MYFNILSSKYDSWPIFLKPRISLLISFRKADILSLIQNKWQQLVLSLFLLSKISLWVYLCWCCQVSCPLFSPGTLDSVVSATRTCNMDLSCCFESLEAQIRPWPSIQRTKLIVEQYMLLNGSEPKLYSKQEEKT
jgi:hypothetical protein